jgi:hypothetical protein
MAAQRQYPPGLGKVAERFGLTPDQLVEQIANGELEVFRPGEEEDELSNEELLENFRQGWREAMRGEVYPIETLWEDLDDE